MVGICTTVHQISFLRHENWISNALFLESTKLSKKFPSVLTHQIPKSQIVGKCMNGSSTSLIKHADQKSNRIYKKNNRTKKNLHGVYFSTRYTIHLKSKFFLSHTKVGKKIASNSRRTQPSRL